MAMRAAVVDGVVTAFGMAASGAIIVAFGVYGSYTSSWMAAGLPLSIGAGYLGYRVCARNPSTGTDTQPGAAAGFAVLTAIIGVCVFQSFSDVWTVWTTTPVNVTITERWCGPNGDNPKEPCTPWLHGFVTATEQDAGDVQLCDAPDLPEKGDQVLVYVDPAGRRLPRHAACAGRFGLGEIVFAAWLMAGTGAVAARVKAAYDRPRRRRPSHVPAPEQDHGDDEGERGVAAQDREPGPR